MSSGMRRAAPFMTPDDGVLLAAASRARWCSVKVVVSEAVAAQLAGAVPSLRHLRSCACSAVQRGHAGAARGTHAFVRRDGRARPHTWLRHATRIVAAQHRLEADVRLALTHSACHHAACSDASPALL